MSSKSKASSSMSVFPGDLQIKLLSLWRTKSVLHEVRLLLVSCHENLFLVLLLFSKLTVVIIFILQMRKLSFTEFLMVCPRSHCHREGALTSVLTPPKAPALRKIQPSIEKHVTWVHNLSSFSPRVSTGILADYGVSLSTSFIINKMGMKMTKWLNELLNV